MAPSPLDDAIARQYGTWVYPKPAQDLEAYARAGRDTCDPALCHRLFWPDRDPAPLDILVAGCGANQAADIAFHNRTSRVLGIDVSDASLAHERYLKDRHGLANLELLRVAIEDAPTLGRDFDLIIATGVLHHMADPVAGMKSLGGCLRRDGVLAVYLYGRHGRLGVEIMQSLFKLLQLNQDAPSLALVKETLAVLPPEHPVKPGLGKIPDLNFDAGIVDVFLNARERSYTVRECLDFVAAAGLAFQGWVENSHYHPEACLRPDHALYPRLAALPEPEIWEATDLYLCNPGHFFLACRRDRPAAQYRIDFAGPQALDYVPVRRPGVAVMQPDRASGQPARLSRAGLEVPIDNGQAQLLNQVDGRRSVAEIVAAAAAAGLSGEAAQIQAFGREFFRSLWRLGLIFVKLRPAPETDAQAQYELGVLSARRRELGQAMAAFKAAIAAKPDFAAAHDALGLVQAERGDYQAAFDSFRAAILHDPANPDAWTHWAGCMAARGFSFTSVDGHLFDDLLRLLDQPETQPQMVAQTVFAALRHDPEFSHVLSAASDADDYPRTAERLSRIALLLRVLTLTCVNAPDVERTLTLLRRALLRLAASGQRDIGGLPFQAALAVQCFLNDYVFEEMPDDAALAGRLADNVASQIDQGQLVPPAWLAALAAYRPLHGFAWAPKLLSGPWAKEIEALLRIQVREPLEERSLLDKVKRLSPITDAVSQAVRSQYEESPYPRWIKAPLHPRPEPLDRLLGYLFPQTALTGDRWRNPEILIAGCGTGRQAIDAATQYAGARVLAVDLSQVSLAYAMRKTRELGLTNIDYAQADILELAALPQRFDLIECTGVLHHLRDPLAGWRALTALLRPSGVMRIGLYSELARRGVVKARALIAAKGFSSSPQDIRRCRQYILQLAADPAAAAAEPELTALANWEIYNLNECRDLLFHVQEHRVTLPQIQAALSVLGLEFLGFEDPVAIQDFRRAYPDPAALASLAAWHSFETANPDTFIGMYQFWCRKP